MNPSVNPSVGSSVSALTLTQLAQRTADQLSRQLEQPATVRCVINRGKLMVLVEYGDGQPARSAEIFEQTEMLIRQQLTESGLPDEASDLMADSDELVIQLYLKQAGAGQPKDMHRFSWQLSEGFEAVFGEKSLADAEANTFEPAFPDTLANDADASWEDIGDTGTNIAFDPDDSLNGGFTDETIAYSEAEEDTEVMPGAPGYYGAREPDDIPDSAYGDALHPPAESEAPELTSSELEAEADALWGGALEAEPASDDAPEVAAVDQADVASGTPNRRQFELPVASRSLAIGVLATVVVGGLGYFITRPCTFGRCDRIAKAQALGEAARLELSNNPPPQTVLDMRSQLKTAVNQLRPIPPWSAHRDEAQALLAIYQSEVDDLDSVIAAQQEATQAAEASQSPPHPIEHWQSVADEWRAAIAQLETISTDSTIHDEIVAPKLTEYRNNLKTIEGRIAAEQAADNSVNQALQSALLATKLAEKATSLEAWETALRSWENAVRQLRQIPQGTLAYGEAQKLLPKYDTELGKVRTRTRQERVANQFYNEAVRYASEARRYETDNQWTLALLNWRDALTQAKGIPQGTARSSEAQTLVKTYESSLADAQENLRLAMRFQKASNSFNSVCGSALQYCTYSMKNGNVRVNIASGYDNLVELSITPPTQRPAPNANQQMVYQANNMLERITNIGKQTQLPIELYDNQGGFIARYKPDLDGYVKR
ncbi:MAG: hypothetical protein F6J97_05455 [Leptolyngbya sp. SIO4C1]|nr:hypothetical protein [Leptolyngbya sp. SIO4C1]